MYILIKIYNNLNVKYNENYEISIKIKINLQKNKIYILEINNNKLKYNLKKIKYIF